MEKIKERLIHVIKIFSFSGYFSLALSIIGGVLFLVLCANIKFFLPFSPVPITLQTFGIFLISLLYAYPKGVFTVILYILGGILGLPFFAGLSTPGLHYLWGPTGGYLLAFILASFIINRFKNQNLFFETFLLFSGNVMIYFLGALWLYIWFNLIIGETISVFKVLDLGVFPFIVGDTLKIFLAISLYRLFINAKKII